MVETRRSLRTDYKVLEEQARTPLPPLPLQDRKPCRQQQSITSHAAYTPGVCLSHFLDLPTGIIQRDRTVWRLRRELHGQDQVREITIILSVVTIYILVYIRVWLRKIIFPDIYVSKGRRNVSLCKVTIYSVKKLMR
jgi:hypothetical protein